MAEIGATLREARMRARIDVSEIEAQTKIRAKYLRALENEEWDLLPGPDLREELSAHLRAGARTSTRRRWSTNTARTTSTPARSTAPSRLVTAEHEEPARAGAARVHAGPRAATRSRSGVVGLLIVLLVVAADRQSGGSSTQQDRRRRPRAARLTRAKRTPTVTAHTPASASAASASSLSLKPTGPVYVCLIGDGGRKADPRDLTPNPAHTRPSTYHAHRFTLTLGNNAVTMYVDGTPRIVPPSSQAIGYSITKRRPPHARRPRQQPTCK